MIERPHRLASVELDETSLPSTTAEIEHARQVAIFDLVEANSFEPAGAPGGPYRLRLSILDSRLAMDVSGPDWARGVLLSLTPLKTVLRDYRLICDSYYEALRGSSPSQIEAVDMGRRGLHNEGADLLRSRLAGKIALDHETARRLFTLIVAVVRKS